MAVISKTDQQPVVAQFEEADRPGCSVYKKQNQILFDKILQRLSFASDPKIPKTSAHDPKKYTERFEKILLSHPDRIIKIIALSMLGKNGVISTVQDEIVTEETWDDLNLFKGAGTSGLSFVDRIARTGTELGRGYLMGLVSCPTTNVYKLRARQELIRGLIQTGLADQISTFLHSEQVQDGEKQLLSCWDERIEYPSSVTKMFYRSQFDQLANRSPLALDLSNGYNLWKRFGKIAMKVSAGSCMVFSGLNALVPFAPPNLVNPAKRVASKFIGTSGIVCTITSMVPSRVAKAATFIVAGLIALRTLNDLAWVRADFATDRIVHKKFLSIATYYKAIKELYSSLISHPDLADCLEHFQELQEFCENKNLKNIFAVLGSSTFFGEAGLLFRRGNVLYLLNQLKQPEVRNQFEAALTAVAEIDAFVSAAKLVKEFENKRVTFCFPEYVNGKRAPELHINNFWNVFVDPEKVVCNPVNFSGSSPIRCHLITGPNGGGKTTILRSIAEDIILGQSLGIVSARDCSMTPFTFVTSSMNVADSQGQESHFQAECHRISEIQRKLNALDPRQFAYAALDELYSGTSHEESSALARTLLGDLGMKKKNVVSMVVTHDEALTKLEKAPESGIKNFKVVVDNQAQPLFRLLEGTSDQHTALQVAKRNGHSSEQIDAAQQFLCKK